MSRCHRWIIALVVAVAVCGAIVYVSMNDPAKPGIFPTCVFHKLTGLHCPGCGGTRAAHAFFNGDVMAAIAWNPFVLVGIPIILALCAYDTQIRKRGASGIKYLAKGVLIVVVAFFVLRNVPSPQNGLLAPWDIRGAMERDQR